MFDAFTKVVSQADSRGEYVSAGQLDALNSIVKDSLKRADAVNRITGSASTIVANAVQKFLTSS
jgi:phycocyanin beta chain